MLTITKTIILKNRYEFYSDGSVWCYLNSRKYPGIIAVLDEDDFDKVKKYNWYPALRSQKFYALSDDWNGGNIIKNYMHRLILTCKSSRSYS